MVKPNLFRVRLKGEEQWFADFSINVQDDIIVGVYDNDDDEEYSVDDLDINQSIGKKDANGKLIFEEDKFEDGYTVAWSEGKLGWVKTDEFGNEFEIADSDVVED